MPACETLEGLSSNSPQEAWCLPGYSGLVTDHNFVAPCRPWGTTLRGGAQIWAKPLADGRIAVLLFNMGDHARDITLDYARDLPDDADRWARDIALPAGCKDKDKGCAEWAKAGECTKNSAFMLDRCPRSCQASARYARVLVVVSGEVNGGIIIVGGDVGERVEVHWWVSSRRDVSPLTEMETPCNF